ncbi:MAG TPA: adenylyl cyclase, partial [Candidatus Dormibacteraeota bacterium]|nr:adenylyl cyclase [Candidatus Dormibacteraeota bacterium]
RPGVEEMSMRTFLCRLYTILTAGALVAGAVVATAGAFATTALASSSDPEFGPNVYVFDPTMPQSQIQAAVDGIATQQVNNEFGQQRYALLFKPGTYGSKTNPLIFQVGYYTSVAGLGLLPSDTVVNGAIDVFNHCSSSGGRLSCIALTNFWRSMSNLTINVTLPKTAPTYVPASPDPAGAGCNNSNEMWAVSQAAPMRHVAINGFITLFDYCGPDAFASGGFIADSKLNGVLNGSQQQWMTRNSKIDFWTNAVWNQVFSGVIGAPAESFPNPTYTTLATSPVTREAPFLYVDAEGKYRVFVPSALHNTSGTSWSSGTMAGTSLPISKFYLAEPDNSADTINAALRRGKNLILTPGIYHLDDAIKVTRPDSIVLGLGFATLQPTDGNAAMTVDSAKGMLLSGFLFDAGTTNSPVLLQMGDRHNRSTNDASDPSLLADVFFRIGGPAAGKATTSLVVDSNNVILDDLWAWRADHGTGVGWNSNTADTGVIVNGANVTAYGLFVEHYQKYEVIWKGNGGTDVFFQNEMPYDVPSQAAWMEAPGVDGYAAFKVAPNVKTFTGYGMGSYSFFNQGLDIFAERAFEVPATLPAGSLHDLLSLFLDKVHGKGGILHVVNETGGSSTIANPDVPVPVVSYP